ncbi:MAG TPA: hypothetical protein VMX17_04160 [Candidatus Glassbacteria bacterium]|nr:hypothetical protein [Candidatus Glassbacteria bacterium]
MAKRLRCNTCKDKILDFQKVVHVACVNNKNVDKKQIHSAITKIRGIGLNNDEVLLVDQVLQVFNSADKTKEAVNSAELAKNIFVHIQEKRFAFTLESIERIITNSLPSGETNIQDEETTNTWVYWSPL